MSSKQKFHALKAAPAWKRILAYFIDSAILFLCLLLFILFLYGDNFTALLTNINELGAMNLIYENGGFPLDQIDPLAQMTTYEQNMAYWMYIIQSKYGESIYLLSQILSVLYYVMFWWSTGQTIGAKLLKIKVISPLLPRIPIPSLLIRIATLKLAEIVFGLPLLVITNRALKQRIHDSLSSTVVIEEFEFEDDEESLDEESEDQEESISISHKD